MFISRVACSFLAVVSFSVAAFSSPVEAQIKVEKRQIPGLADVTGVLDEANALLDTFLPEIADLPFTGSIEETELPGLVADIVGVLDNGTLSLQQLGLPIGSITPDDDLVDVVEGIISSIVTTADNLQNNAVIANIGQILSPLDVVLNDFMAYLFDLVPELLDTIIDYVDAGPLVDDLLSLGFELVLLLLGLLTI